MRCGREVGELEHFALQLYVLDVVKVLLRFPYLVGVAQSSTEDPLSERFERNDTLTFVQDDTPQGDNALAPHSIADHSERFLAHVVVWRDVIRAIVKTFVDLLDRNETVDLDGVLTLDLERLNLLVIDRDEY